MDYSHFDSVITQPFDESSNSNLFGLDKIFNLDVRNLLKGLDGMVFLVDYINAVNESYWSNKHGLCANNLLSIWFHQGVDPRKSTKLLLNKCSKYEILKISKRGILLSIKAPSIGCLKILISLYKIKSLSDLLISYNWTGLKLAFDATNLYYTPYVKYCFETLSIPMFIQLTDRGFTEALTSFELVPLNGLALYQWLLKCSHPTFESDAWYYRYMIMGNAALDQSIDELSFKYVEKPLLSDYLCERCSPFYQVSLFSKGVYEQHKRRLTHLYITLRSLGLLPELVISVYYLMTSLETHDLIAKCRGENDRLDRPFISDDSSD